MLRLDQKAVAYAATSLGSGLMNAVFSFYYVKVFLNFYHVDETWFHASQTIFMIWNALNDPLFGYMQDNMSFSWVKSRRHSILYGAPLYAIAFLVPWFPWGDYTNNVILSGIHLLFALCFYDTLLTFVLLAQCALFTELSQKYDDRLTLVRYAQVASLIGSSSVFFCDMVSNGLQNMFNFQVACVVIAVLAFLCIRYTGLYSITEYDRQVNVLGKRGESSDVIEESAISSIIRQTLQIMKQQSFISFVLVNFCQIFHMTYLSNFTGIIYDQLVPKHMIPDILRSILYGAMFITPQLLVICGTPVIGRIGYFKVIRASFIAKLILPCLLYAVGPGPVSLGIFFLIDNYPLSSMVFGLNALITKPAQSVSPMLIVAVLNYYGYSKLTGGSTLTAGSPVMDTLAADPLSLLQEAMFIIICSVPVIVGTLQLLIWCFFTIRNSHAPIPEHIET